MIALIAPSKKHINQFGDISNRYVAVKIDICADETCVLLATQQAVNQSSYVTNVNQAIVIHVANSIAMSFTMQNNGLGLAPRAPGVVGVMGLHAEEEGAAGCQVLNCVELVTALSFAGSLASPA